MSNKTNRLKARLARAEQQIAKLRAERREYELAAQNANQHRIAALREATEAHNKNIVTLDVTRRFDRGSLTMQASVFFSESDVRSMRGGLEFVAGRMVASLIEQVRQHMNPSREPELVTNPMAYAYPPPRCPGKTAPWADHEREGQFG